MLKAGDRVINCHQGIITAFSPVLKRMLNWNERSKKERQDKMDNISPWTLEILVKYMYIKETRNSRGKLKDVVCCWLLKDGGTKTKVHRALFTTFRVKKYFPLNCRISTPLLANGIYQFQCLRDSNKSFTKNQTTSSHKGEGAQTRSLCHTGSHRPVQFV